MANRFDVLRSRLEALPANAVKEAQPTAAIVTRIVGTGTKRVIWVNPISQASTGSASSGDGVPVRHTGQFDVAVGDHVLITRARSQNSYIIGYLRNAAGDKFYPPLRADTITSPGGTLTLPGSVVGAVTSEALSMPSEFSVSGSPITSSGTLAVSKANQSANLVYAGPSSGGAAAPTFRALVSGDIPDLTQYALLAGRATGQVLYGGTAAGEDLTLISTAHATKGSVFIGVAGVGKLIAGSLGVGNAPSALAPINFVQTITDSTVARHSLQSSIAVATPGVNTAGLYYAAFYDSRLNDGSNLTSGGGGLVGAGYIIRHQGAGTITRALTLDVGGPVVEGGGVITTWEGIRFTGASITSGSVTTGKFLSIPDVTFAGTNYAIETNAGLVVINQGGDANSDFRVEGDADANLLVSDASADMVGIGTNAPTTKAHVLLNDAGTAAVVNVLTLGHNSSGTPAAGFGTGLIFEGESDTTISRSMGRITSEWATATHASRKARMKFTAFDAAGEREGIRIEASGSAPMLGFFGVNAVVRPTALTAQLTTITHTAPGTPDYAVQDLTQTTPYGFVTKDEGNTVLSVVANLQTRVGEIETKLQALGLLT